MNIRIFLCYQLISLHSCKTSEGEAHVPSLTDLKCFFDVGCHTSDGIVGADYSNVPVKKKAELFVTIHGSDQLMALGLIDVPKPEKYFLDYYRLTKCRSQL